MRVMTILFHNAKIQNLQKLKVAAINCGDLTINQILKFDKIGKLAFDENNDIIFPDSSGIYCEPGGFRSKSLFVFNYDKKGYFFIIKLETIRNYTWEEIRKNKLYDKMIVTKKMLEENNWKIDYYP